MDNNALFLYYFPIGSLAVGGAVFVLVYILLRPKRNLPPGPTAFPVIGTALSFNPDDTPKGEALEGLQKRYGDIVTLQVLGQYTIILNSYDVIREAFVTRTMEYTNREIGKRFTRKYFNHTESEIITRDFDDGARKLRGHCLTIFRNLGVGRAVMEGDIAHEAGCLADTLRAIGTQARDVSAYVNVAVSNVILKILLDKRHAAGDSEQTALNESTNQMMKAFRLLPLFDLALVLRDFVTGGSEMTTTSLQWTLLLLANHPQVQDKLYAALTETVGSEREYKLDDKIPYLDAVVWEVQRYASIIPTAVPHAVSTSGDGTLAGYTIPKGSLVIPNLYGVHHSVATWGDPHNFRPERFLDASGAFVKHAHVMPFSLGKRSCLGELLARQELYIFTALLAHSFHFLPPEGAESIDTTPDYGFSRIPKAFKIRAIPR